MMLIFNFILFFCFIGMFSNVNAQNIDFSQYKWHTITAVGEPVARHEAAFVESSGLFYLLGGRRIQSVSIFDPKNNTWSKGAKPPLELHHFQGFSFKGDIYAVGAMTGEYPFEKPLPNIYIYRPRTDEWLKGPAMPSSRLRGSAGTAIYKNKLYVVGGIVNGHWGGHVKWFDCYDFNTQKWTALPDAPRFRDHFSAVVCQGKLFLVGGRVTSGNINKVFDITVNEIDVFDFKKGEWSTLDTHFMTERAGGTAICVNKKIIFAGGESVMQNTAHNEVECLDLRKRKIITLAPLIQGRHGTQLVLYRKKLYIASGSGNLGGSPELTTIEVFVKE
jgi:hypothetical protein